MNAKVGRALIAWVAFLGLVAVQKEAQYWMDVGTIESYYQANMDLVAVQPLLNLYDREWPIRTRKYQYPPAKFVFADEGLRMGVAVDSIVSAGCILSGGRAISSVLSQDVRVNSYSLGQRSILFPHVAIGRHCLIKNAIIDRGVQIPEHTVIGYDVASDRSKYTVTDGGIVVVSPERGDREEQQTIVCTPAGATSAVAVDRIFAVVNRVRSVDDFHGIES